MTQIRIHIHSDDPRAKDVTREVIRSALIAAGYTVPEPRRLHLVRNNERKMG